MAGKHLDDKLDPTAKGKKSESSDCDSYRDGLAILDQLIKQLAA